MMLLRSEGAAGGGNSGGERLCIYMGEREGERERFFLGKISVPSESTPSAWVLCIYIIGLAISYFQI